MLVVISPAKKLNTTLSNDVLPSKPQFSKHAIELASVANELSITELKKLMGLSDSLAELNSERFASENRVKEIDDLKKFNLDNYHYQKELSTETSITLLRK